MIIIRQIVGKADAASRRATAQCIVDEHCGCSIVRDASGAPSLATNEAFISISHTAQFVAVAIGNKEQGVDIELVDRQVAHLASRFASAAEIEIARGVFAQNPALLLWCAKEATYKTLHRDGVDFAKDMIITSAVDDRLTAIADSISVELRWEKREDNLLIVYTI